MKARLKRIYLGETYTIGKFYVENVYICDTLEDKNRDINKNGKFDGSEKKVYSETCIPYGTYEVVLTYSPKFKRLLPLLKDVPDFTGVRIHRGNTIKDTAGCILPGQNKIKGKVLYSGIEEEKIIKILKKCKENNEKFYLTVE